MNKQTTEPFSHPVQLDTLESEPRHFVLDATEDERRTLAERYDVSSIEALSAELDVSRSGTLVTVEGQLKAELSRTCVVSLEPMSETIDEAFVADFTTETDDDVEGEYEADLDAPEPLEGDTIDLGGVVLEQLVLAMDPHPRKEGATPPEDPGAGRESSPFDVLKNIGQ